MNRTNRIKHIVEKINFKNLINILKTINTDSIIIPRDDQNKIIEKAILHFQNNNKGLLIIPCGGGKTLISLWIT